MRTGVVVFLKGPFVSEVENFRRRHDPAFCVMPAHLSIAAGAVPASAERQFQERLESLTASLRAFRVTFGGISSNEEGVLTLRIVEGAPELRALRASVRQEALRAGLQWVRDPHPRALVGRVSDPEKRITCLCTTRLAGAVWSVPVEALHVVDRGGISKGRIRFSASLLPTRDAASTGDANPQRALDTEPLV